MPAWAASASLGSQVQGQPGQLRALRIPCPPSTPQVLSTRADASSTPSLNAGAAAFEAPSPAGVTHSFERTGSGLPGLSFASLPGFAGLGVNSPAGAGPQPSPPTPPGPRTPAPPAFSLADAHTLLEALKVRGYSCGVVMLALMVVHAQVAALRHFLSTP